LKRRQDVKTRRIGKPGSINSRLKSVMIRASARLERKNPEKAKEKRTHQAVSKLKPFLQLDNGQC
jgi:hypothetical protein